MCHRRFALACGLIFLIPVMSWAQIPSAGAVYGVSGPLPYKTTNPTWSFEATTEYFNGNRVQEIIHVLYTSEGIRQDQWQNFNPEVVNIDTKQPPNSVFLYDRKTPDLLFQGTPTETGLLFRPTRTSCLTIFLKKLKTEGDQSVRRRYDIPAKLDFKDIWSILSETAVGAGVPPSGIKNFGMNFAVNSLPSGFGWPMFMFRLTVCTPDSLKINNVTLKATGRENVAGVPCLRYTMEQGGTTLWVEPKTHIVLRQESVYAPRGRRVPPTKGGYVIRSFRFVKNVSRTNFLLPPGATVELPELLIDLPLPAHVKRKQMKGPEAKTGFPLRKFSNMDSGVVQ